ncbi:MAG: hypothetical protein C0623_00515 [Desulfuromonas sp.]|nr:MAG: hypothetical protein C0623_00515 [Desulfuromonas sp.]
MSKKLLLADDSITIQKVIGITFAHEDYDLTIVDNGDAALQKAQGNKPDLIMADVFMPGKNGYELCAAVKQDPNLQNVPVLLLTGTFEPFDEEKAVSSGANGWISKPFESQALIGKVEELLGGAPAAAPAQPAAPAQAPPAQPAAPAPPQPAAPTASEPDDWGDVSFDETPAAAPTEAVEPQVFEDESDFIIDDGTGAEAADTSDVWADTGDAIEMAEPEVVAVEPTPPAPPETPAAPAQPAPPVQPTPPPVQPAAPAPSSQPAAPAGNIEAQVAGMSEADLQVVVERVAGAVLEKIAWEVVPDLAENLIKDEIRKLKSGA